MSLPGRVQPKSSRANYGPGFYRTSNAALGVSSSPIFAQRIGMVGSAQTNFFKPANASINVFVSSSNNVNISISPVSIMSSSPQIADPLRRVREDNARVIDEAVGARNEILRNNPERKYENNARRVNKVANEKKGCCTRFMNWICCKP